MNSGKSNDPVLSIRGLCKSFGPTEIIRGVDLELRAGERRALIGPNGAGKSTLFHLISGNLRPTAGEIVLDGQRIDGWSPVAASTWLLPLALLASGSALALAARRRADLQP